MKRIFGAGDARPADPAVRKVLSTLPPEPGAALTELAGRAASAIRTQASDLNRLSNALLSLGAAANDCLCRIQCDYFAPKGVPSEGREVAALAFRPMLEAAAAFAAGHAAARAGAVAVGGAKKGVVPLFLGEAIWLGRKLVLASVLRDMEAGALWQQAVALWTNALSMDSGRHGLVATEQEVGGQPSSVAQEYGRLMMMEICGPDTLHGRELELAFRIAGLVVPHARLQYEPTPTTLFGVALTGASKPLPVARIDRAAPALYLDTSGCLPPLKALVERGSSSEAKDPDVLFDRLFTVREASSVAARLMEQWGAHPPRRRSQRIALDLHARVRCGVEDINDAIASLEQGAGLAAEEARAAARAPRRAVRETDAQIVDASAEGLGLLVSRKDASWVRLGALIGVCVEPGPEWTVGRLRRIGAQGDMLRLGISILARRPRRAWFHVRSAAQGAGEAHEARAGQAFHEFYTPCVLLDADLDGILGGQFLVPRGALKLNARLELPLDRKILHLSLVECEETAVFDQMSFKVSAQTSGSANAAEEDELVFWHAAL